MRPIRALLGLIAFAAPAQTAAPDFDRVVAPLLSRHCIDCHGGLKPKGGLDLSRRKTVLERGKGGPVVVPGKLDDSLLWQRVRDDEMPPKKRLSREEKDVFRDWIATGAAWGSDPIDSFRLTTDRRAGYDWWSLRPVHRPALPAVKATTWAHNPVDAFILAGVEAKGLSPSPPANRRTLIRRVFFDLVGLPPTPEEVEAFVRDANPLAYDKLVDRLLASPHYGERWARHWLDVVRYGESDGFERNMGRENAWPYRDWVIRALNTDLPYDQFCRLQLAGDVIAPGDADAVRATGYLVAGVHNTVVGGSKEMQENARQDELEDLVGNVGQTFLGLTVNCGRCHDHKFDPVPQADYYRLAAALAGVQHGERDLPAPAAQAALAHVRTEAQKVEKEIAEIEEPARRAVLATRGATGAAPAPVAAWDFKGDLRDRAGELHGDAVGPAAVGPGGVSFEGKGFIRTVKLARDLREKTLEAWVRLDNLGQRGGGVLSVQTPEGDVFDAIVFGEREPGRWMAGSDFFRRTQSFGGPAETEALRRPIHVAITYHADGTIAGYRDGKPYGKPYRSGGPVLFKAGAAVVLFGCRHEPAGGNKMLAGTVVRARLYDRALSADEVSASAAAGGEFVGEAELAAKLTPTDRTRRTALRLRLATLMAEQARLGKQAALKAYLALGKQPPRTFVLIRGQASDPGPLVAASGLRALPGADLGLGPDAPEAQRRVRLAQWLTRPDNPPFARVLANRLWHYHFGTGIVDTPSDLGFNGGRPSHPELLDWLAAELVDRQWSLKTMHRLMVTSAAYRQASTPRPNGLAADAGSRLLWRKPPVRLEGEALRDTMLLVAGLLNHEVGGKGFSDYRAKFESGTTYFEPIDLVGPAFQRRSVYRFTPRGGNQGLLDSFDCPDPAAAAPRRSVTTTPLQALALWNNGFALRMADALAQRVMVEAADADRRVERAFQLTFQRLPRPAELESARRLVAEHGLAALCRVLLNANELLVVD